MSVVVHGELTADAQTIILMASGPDHEVARAAAHLQTLTPLIKATEPAGALQLPATWAAVVQLSATFGAAWQPGPGLAAWIGNQLAARTSDPGELTVRPPAGLTPRPYQVAAARMIGAVGSGLLFDDQGPQPVTTPILTPTGWTELGALKLGDVVFDLRGRPTPVRAVKHFGEQPVYRVTLNDRTSTLATARHRWRVFTSNDRKRGTAGRVLSTVEMLEAGLRHQNGNTIAARFYLPQQPVLRLLDGGDGELPLDPYAYGALLGDGALGGTTLSLTCPDESIRRAAIDAAVALGTTTRETFPRGGRCPSVVFHRDGKLRTALDELDALHGAAGKSVHDRYRLAPIEVRRLVLAGLLDTDGSVIGNGTAVEFSSASPALARDVAWLARSLGAVVTESDPQPAGYRGEDGERVECLPRHRLTIRFPADGPNPFRLPRKADAWAAMASTAQRRNPPRTVQSIEPEGTAEVCCIELDTDDDLARVYLTDTTLIPTHNTGKTITTILGLRERHGAGHPVLPVVIVCPNAVVDSWVEHVHRWAPGWRAVAWRGTPKRRLRLAGTADVYVTSYGTARMDASTADVRAVAQGKAPLLTLDARMLVADECVPPGTPIDTPTGPRPIEALEVGDEVLGVDHATGELVTTTVRQTFANAARALIYVGGVAMTPDHPVWTARGYVPARAVRHDDLICEVRPDGQGAREVRMVRHDQGARRLSQQTGTEVLLDDVLGSVAPIEPGSASDTRRAPARPDKPVPGPVGAGEGAGGGAGARLPGADGRQRSGSDAAAGAALGRIGLADGGRDSYGNEALVVQGRRRVSGTADCDRGGRGESQRPEGTGARRAEGRMPARAGLDGAALPEPSSAGGAGGCAHRDQGGRVHNIETGTGNYVAAGLLVHNCHKVKSAATEQSRAVRRIAARAATLGGGFVGLSGTPITHSPKDLWPALYCLAPGAWPSSERWVHRYCDTIPGEYADTVVGLRPQAEPEFRDTLLGQYRRVSKADVLADLPPKVYSVRHVDLPKAYREAYDALEKDMLAELPDGGQLEAMTVLAQLTRLLQLASAAADVKTWTEIVEDPATGLEMEKTHQEVTLRAPSWKVDELLEVMAERPGQQVAAYAPSRQLMMLAGEAAAAKGYRVGYVVGGQTSKERTENVEAFQRGDLDLICVTTGAGGVGITLTAAGTAVFLQRPWSLVEALQAEDRQHRIGSERHDSVEIIDVLSTNTIETRVRAILKERAGQLSDLVGDPRIVAELLGGASVRDLRRKKAAA